ncbi:MAG: FAD-dependent oxidoreductase [Oscillospiraceae bacterium]|nr:FAD-dependent oxidoreductase [Oscillospiraceae bacterium]
MYTYQYPNLLKPIKIRELVVKNRIMSAPNMLFRTIGGRPDEYYVRYLEHKARGGAGIVSLGEANVCDGGNHTPGMETTLENLTIYSEMAQAIHEHGAAANVELTHGGMRVKPQFNKDRDLLMGPVEFDNPETGAHIRAMTQTDMEYVANGFADTAEYYYHAGFDTVLIHCAHNWLLTQFLSPIINTRTDEYGGSLENRMRFPLYVMKKVRERVGDRKTVMVRLSGSERHPDGFTPADITEFLAKAQEYVDMAEISTENFNYIFASAYMPRGQNAQLAEEIKKSGRISIPIYTIGSIMEPDQAEEIIASGVADGVSMSRALIADPYLPKKTAVGRKDEITPCLRCLNCTDSDNTTRHFICSVNPRIAREARLGFGDNLEPAKVKKTVMIVGGGPAGMQAAITATERGHDVTIVERGSALGGTLRFTKTDTIKHDLRRFTEYLIRKTMRSGAKILLNTWATDEVVDWVRPDNIIVATGSEPIVPSVKGIGSARHALDVYLAPDFEAGERVVMIGGGMVGIETGLHLAQLGKKVTVLELLDDFARDARGVNRFAVVDKVKNSGIDVITEAATTEVTETGVTYSKDGAEHTVQADTVLYAIGMRPREGVFFDLYDKAPFITLAGDAKTPGKVAGAVHGGFFAAMDV